MVPGSESALPSSQFFPLYSPFPLQWPFIPKCQERRLSSTYPLLPLQLPQRHDGLVMRALLGRRLSDEVGRWHIVDLI